VSDDDVLDAFDGEVLDLIIPGTLDEIRLDRVLALLTGLSRSETSVIISSGAVTLDDKVIVKSSTPVREGRHLVAVLPAPESANVEADPNVAVDVVLDDVDFAVINKAPGQVVHPGAGHRDGTLVAGLLALYPEMRDLSEMGLCDPCARVSCTDWTRGRRASWWSPRPRRFFEPEYSVGRAAHGTHVLRHGGGPRRRRARNR